MKIGVMFGNPETTTGGNALKFYSSVRLEIRRIESIESKSSEDAVGNHVRVKVVKNKVAPPFRKVEIDIYFGKGISAVASLLDSAVKHGLIDKKGAWYTAGEEKVGQGKENAIGFLEQNKEFTQKIETQLREKLFPFQVLKAKEMLPSGKIAAAKASAKMRSAADSRVELTPKGSAVAKEQEKSEAGTPPSELF